MPKGQCTVGQSELFCFNKLLAVARTKVESSEGSSTAKFLQIILDIHGLYHKEAKEFYVEKNLG